MMLPSEKPGTTPEDAYESTQEEWEAMYEKRKTEVQGSIESNRYLSKEQKKQLWEEISKLLEQDRAESNGILDELEALTAQEQQEAGKNIYREGINLLMSLNAELELDIYEASDWWSISDSEFKEEIISQMHQRIKLRPVRHGQAKLLPHKKLQHDDLYLLTQTKINSETGEVYEERISEEEYFKKYPRGEFPEKERAKRFEVIAPGVKVFRDMGVLTFYEVQHGDNIIGITQKLHNTKEFSHIPVLTKEPTTQEKMTGFNIRSKELKPGMLIPIPLPTQNRHLTDEQFAEYCRIGLREIQKNPHYGDKIKKLIDSGRVTVDQILTMCVAIAKQESGGKPLGQYEFHRWEPGNKDRLGAFSFSIFHILMEKGRDGWESPGLKARRNLQMTEGQLYHPVNAAMLFLAYIIEKSNASYANFFPLDQNLEGFARLYNGNYWRTVNPHYVKNVRRYYREAYAWISGEGVIGEPEPIPPVSEPEPTPARVAKKEPEKKLEPETKPAQGFETIGNKTLYQSISDLNWKLGENRPFKTNGEIKQLIVRIQSFLIRMYETDTYFDTDELTLGQDETGPFIIFKRKNDENRIRPPKENPTSPATTSRETQGKKGSKPSPQPKTQIRETPNESEKMGNKRLKAVIENINWKYKEKHGETLLKSDQDIQKWIDRIEMYLQRSYNNKKPNQDDTLTIGKDKYGVFMIYERGKTRSTLRLDKK